MKSVHVQISRKILVLLWKDKSYLRSEKNSYSCQNIFYRIFSFLRKAFSFSAILIFWWSFFPPYLLPPKLLRRIFVLGAPIFMRRSFIVLHMSWNLSLNFWGLYLNAWKAQKSSKISPAKKEGNFEWNRVFYQIDSSNGPSPQWQGMTIFPLALVRKCLIEQ